MGYEGGAGAGRNVSESRQACGPAALKRVWFMKNIELFELVTTRSGALSIRNVALNETMHGPVGPWGEANALYVVPSGLTARLVAPTPRDLVLFDVGLGAAANALAAIRAALDLGASPRRRLHVVSFERDMNLLAFALDHFEAFPHFAGFRAAIEAVLRTHEWRSPCGTVKWELRVGDFLATIGHEASRPDLVFHDPYSPAANQEMWNVACFEKLRKLAWDGPEPTSLYTYSCATPVRAALLLAGFFVGLGPSTGLKKNTTQASTRREGLADPVGERWLRCWQRSHTRYPLGTRPDAYEAVTGLMREHPQFVGIPWAAA